MVILSATYATSSRESCIKSLSSRANFSQALDVVTKQCLLCGEGQNLP